MYMVANLDKQVKERVEQDHPKNDWWEWLVNDSE